MQTPGFEEDATVGPENAFSFGEGCDTTRIYNLENTFAREFRGIDMRLTSIEAVLPHLATKADLIRLDARVQEIQAVIPHLATKADLSGLETKMHAAMSKLQASMMRWFLASTFTIITVVAVLIGALKRMPGAT